jgi:hypothetical protein
MTMKKTLILFVTVVVVSMVVMLVAFSLFFDQLSLKFNTRQPDTAPVVGNADLAPPASLSEGLPLGEADVNVPSEVTAKPLAPFMGIDAAHPEPAVVEDSLVNPATTEPPPDTPVVDTSTAEAPTPSPAPAAPTLYRVYIAGFASEQEATQALSRYQSAGQSPVVKRHKGQVIIQLGVMGSLEAARKLADATGAAVDPL